MRLFTTALVSGLLLTTATFAAAPTPRSSSEAVAQNPEALQVTKPIYQWKTESSNDKDGFNHCLVKNMYDNGTMMILAENREHITRLALHFPQDKMQPNQQFDLTIQVDKRDVFPVEAAAVSPQVLTIGIPDTLPDQMKRGNALYLRGPKDEVIFTLDGMNGAVEALRDCVTTNLAAPDKVKLAKNDKSKKNLVPDDLLDAPPPQEEPMVPKDPYDVTAYDETAQPAEEAKSKNPITALVDKLKGDGEDKREIKVAEAKPEPKKPEPAPVIKPEEKKPEAKKPVVEKKPEPKPVAAKPPAPKQDEPVKPVPLLPTPYGDVIAGANLTPETLLMGRAGEKGNKPLDYAWIRDDLFIGLKKQAALPNPSVRLPQLMAGYMQMLKARCAGEFVAEASSFTTTAKGGYIVVEAACAPEGGEDTIAALLFLSNGPQTTIYFVESPGTQGAAAIKARNAILTAALK
jgi:hypothetical protein